MFWGPTSSSASPQVEALLEREDFTLGELLDEEDIVKECKALNLRLINFLRDKTQVENLLRYIVKEPPEQADIKQNFKFPYIACEILTCEIDVIFNTLVIEEKLMDLLFSFLEPNRPHSSLLAGYFSKVVLCLMMRRTVQVMNYVQAHQDVFGHLVDLIGNTSIKEVLIRIVEPVDHIYPDYINVMQWLADNNLLELLVDKLSPYNPSKVNANAAETLCAIARTAPSPLAMRLSSPSFVSMLFGHALEDTHSKSAIFRSLSVLISLIDTRRSFSSMICSFQNQDNYAAPVPVNPDTVRAMLPKLGDLVVLLSVSDDAKILPTTFGVLKPPLGNPRLKIVEFIAVLLKSGNNVVDEELISSGAIQRILDLLFEYPYNNELHHNVERIIYSCLQSKNDIVVNHLLSDCNLFRKILQADKHPTLSGDSNKPTIPSPGKKFPKPGYLGHLTRISIQIVQRGIFDPRIRAHTQENSEWNDWVINVLRHRILVEDVHNWDCGRPTGLQDKTVDDDIDYDNDDNEEGEGAWDEDDEGVSYDGGEVVIKPVMLDDNYGRSLFTNPNWFAYQDDIIDRVRSDDKVAVGKDDGLPESANLNNNSSSRDDISSGEKILENEEDVNLQMEKAGTPGSSTNPLLDQMDTDGIIPSDESTGETVPNGTSTSVSSNPVASEQQAAPVSALSEERVEFGGVELARTEKAREQALKEGIVAEAGPLKGNRVSQMSGDENPEESGPVTHESNDANFLKS